MAAETDPTTNICFICQNAQENDNNDAAHTKSNNLKAFQPNTWESMVKAAGFRKEYACDTYSTITSIINTHNKFNETHLYHSQCLKKFTAAKCKSTATKRIACDTQEPDAKHPKTTTRQNSTLPATTSSGILSEKCIFCNLAGRKKVKGKYEYLSECLTKEGSEAILRAAEARKDQRLLAICRSGDLIAKEAKYHRGCRKEYVDNAESEIDKDTHTSTRQLINIAFQRVVNFVKDEIITEKRTHLLSKLLDLYSIEYTGAGALQSDADRYTAQNLSKKLLGHFGESITIRLLNNRDGNIVYNANLSFPEARERMLDDKYKTIRDAALQLRAIIQSVPKTNTPVDISISSLKAVAPNLPEPLLLFYRTLYQGCDEEYDSTERKVMASASDMMYNTTKGRVQPWKHTVLGIGIGSMTGSKQIVQTLNRFGYCISYDQVKALETEIAFACIEKDTECPDGIKRRPDLGTGVAWDNYDINIETLDGKSTFHSTLGICYQNENHEANTNIPTTTDTIFKGPLRRYFEKAEDMIPPFLTNLKRALFPLSPSDETYNIVEVQQQVIDFWWFLQSLQKPMPLLPGYLSLFFKDDLPQHIVSYLKPISLSPTRNDVVKETMVRSLKIAEETTQDFIVVTYDLAVALKAYSIQSLESPHFDNLLILLGNFHLELALFGALGTFVQESGIEFLLTESGTLAEGSLPAFLKGKIYNRCTRLHQIVANALEKLLFEKYLSTTVSQDDSNALLETLISVPTGNTSPENDLKNDDFFQHYLQEYDDFVKDAINGKYGPTCAFWSIYIYIVNRLHRQLQRAIHTNDITQYQSVLPQIIDIFFSLNRPNYARWGCLFLDKLKTISDQHKNILDTGAFTIRRTPHNYARSAIDITLEQTVNRDAASPLKGIVAFRNSNNAVSRWAITSTQRSTVVSELKHMTGQDVGNLPMTLLQESRVKKDTDHTASLLETIKKTAILSICLSLTHTLSILPPAKQHQQIQPIF